MSNDTVYQMVTERMVTALEAGVVPWQKPWSGGRKAANLVTGKPYRGVNVILLALSALESEGRYTSRWWLTFNQIKTLGGKLTPTPEFAPHYGNDWTDDDGVFHRATETGQKSTVIVFWDMIKPSKVDPDNPNKKIPMLKYYRVFNLNQTEGVKVPGGRAIDDEIAALEFNAIDAAERIIAGYPNPPKMIEGQPEAFYVPSADRINLPPRESFVSVDEFYATAFHELTHSTGNVNRLDRFHGDETFGSHDYGREELIAEMGAAFLSAEAGIESTFENSAAYLGDWIRKIQEDPRAVVVAAGAAQRSTDYILNQEAS